MKNGKKVAIIVTIIIIVLGLIVGGAWAVNEYVINNPKDLFDKYTAQNLSEVFGFDTSLISQIASDNSGKTRETKTNIDFSGTGENIKLEADLKVDKQNDRSELDLDLKKDDNSVLKVQGLNNADKYAFKSDDIANGYIGIENNKLDELANKLSLAIEDVPNKIEVTKGDYESNKKKLMTKLQDEYLPLVLNKFTEDKYVKEKNVTVKRDKDEYAKSTKVTLNTNTIEMRDLLVELLNKAKEDDDLLEKTMTYSVDGYKDEIKKQTKEQIDKLVKSLEELDESKNIKIDTYIYKKQVIKTDIEVEDNGNYSIYKNGDSKKIIVNAKTPTISDFDEVISENSISTSSMGTETESKLELVMMNNVTENSQEIIFKVSGNDEELAIIQAKINKRDNGSDLSVEVSADGMDVMKLKQETEYKENLEIDELNDHNSIIINDRSAEEIQSLIAQLIPLISEVGENTTNKIVDSELENMENDNIPEDDEDVTNNDEQDDENM